jgi:hypothetical protein
MTAHIAWRRLLSGTLLGALSLIAAVGAAPPGDAKLLAKYAPVLVLHPEEPFTPVPVDGFLVDADLLARQPDGTWAPAPGPLETAARGTRLDHRGCNAVDGITALPCYVAAHRAHAARPTVYGAAFRGKAGTALQYWLFYPFNGWSPTVAPGEFWQVHEGDWEAVTILLDAEARPQLVGLSRHCGGIRRAWVSAPKRKGRPLVHVALGSHANGFVAGVVEQERRCWPDAALAVFDAYKVELVDHSAAGRTVLPRVVRVTATTPPWMRFPGSWGEDQYVGFPGVAPFRFGAGPDGPAFHALWRRPFSVPRAWLPG